MSCPDWGRLVEPRDPGVRRDSRDSDDSELDWLAALSHLDSCTSCEHAAFAADPALVFRRLPALELSAVEESAEVESVRRAVAAMRAGRRLERAGHTAKQWRRYAAAAVLALAALWLGVDRRSEDLAGMAPLAAGAPATGAATAAFSARGLQRLPPPAGQPDGAILPAATLMLRGETVTGEGGAGSADISADGAMEGLNRPKARVYQLHGRHMQVVMIVDDKLDV